MGCALHGTHNAALTYVNTNFLQESGHMRTLLEVKAIRSALIKQVLRAEEGGLYSSDAWPRGFPDRLKPLFLGIPRYNGYVDERVEAREYQLGFLLSHSAQDIHKAISTENKLWLWPYLR